MGDTVGNEDGVDVADVGFRVGSLLGNFVGVYVGSVVISDGDDDGYRLGVLEGCVVGVCDGDLLGLFDGVRVGADVGPLVVGGCVITFGLSHIVFDVSHDHDSDANSQDSLKSILQYIVPP